MRNINKLLDQYVDLRNNSADMNGNSDLDLSIKEISDLFNLSLDLCNGKLEPYALILNSLMAGISIGYNHANENL